MNRKITRRLCNKANNKSQHLPILSFYMSLFVGFIIALTPTGAEATMFQIDLGAEGCSFCAGNLNITQNGTVFHFTDGTQNFETTNATGISALDGTLAYSAIASGMPANLEVFEVQPVTPTSSLSGFFNARMVTIIGTNMFTLTITESRTLFDPTNGDIFDSGAVIFTRELTSPVPIPDTASLLSIGLLGLTGYLWQRRRKWTTLPREVDT